MPDRCHPGTDARADTLQGRPSPVSEYDCLHFKLGQLLGNDGTREELLGDRLA